MDVSLKTTKELSIIKLLKENVPAVKVIGMGFTSSQSEIVEFVEAGASGFILKEATTKEFIGTIRIAAHCEKVIPPALNILF